MRALALALAPLLAAPAADWMARLQTTPDEVRALVTSAVRHGHAWLPRGARDLPPAARVEVARAAASFAASFVKSPAFASAWEEAWKAEEPQAPETLAERKARLAAEQREGAAQQAQARQELERQLAAETNPEVKRALREGLAAAAEAQRQLESPEMKALLAQAEAAAAEALVLEVKERREAYEKERAAWLSRKSPKAALRQRLKEFLALSASVDFAARTVVRGERRVFAAAEDEARPAEWKLLYRAGPEVVKVLRQAALELDKSL